eukprot:m.298884 g.298884  ORF g.298884 m.298884 type:complete len:62 (+) comp324279_c0_seq1:3-188(+)
MPKQEKSEPIQPEDPDKVISRFQLDEEIDEEEIKSSANSEHENDILTPGTERLDDILDEID